MTQSNHERVGRALELLNVGLRPFVESRMTNTFGKRWNEEVISNLREHQVAELSRKEPRWDTQLLLTIMSEYWQAAFKSVLGFAERNLVSELRDTRNNWAHQKPLSTDDAYRAYDSVQRLLNAVSASKEASEIERQKQELLRLRFESQARQETRKVNTAPLEGKPTNGLLPWREIVTPHPDVTSGRYQLAEFAADLGQVHRGEGSDEYRNPRDFFQRTYLTYGLRQLLVRALQRLNSNGGDPVVDLQTNFGGGKTHSLLALYHLFSGAPLTDLVGIEPLLKEAGVTRPVAAQRAVLVGHALSPSLPRPKPDGCIVRTMWGELAWQLLGRDGYAMVAEADRQGVSPGTDALRDLFQAAAPSLILIDEWVVYVRQLYHINEPLAGGSFDANLSFAQSLTEAAKSVPQTLVVATIPASDSETGGEGGAEATTRLKNIFWRVESPWRPADAEEGFEIVRRRLFQDINDNSLFIARDTVARAFVDFYRTHQQEFPAECRESQYEKRIQNAYPIHPELFDRLYNDWSSIEKFQRTRGVLRLMAKVVHRLWQSGDKSLLILPASVPVGDSEIKPELVKYLEDNWDPVIEKDIDGSHSLSWQLDTESPTLGRYSACRRVARTMYLGSAPTPHNPNKGLSEDRIKLGSSQPGESISTFGDALRRLSDRSSHLYLDGQRYWYSTQPSVARLAQDRAVQYDDDHVYAEIEKRLRPEQQTRADFARVHICPASSVDIADDDPSVRLVILRAQASHARGDKQSKAWQEVESMLDTRGNSPRTNKNTLVFLAADRSRLEELKDAVRQYLAWDSICAESEMLNLEPSALKQAQTKRKGADETVKARIPETYVWLLVPEQEPRQSMNIGEIRLQVQPQNALAVNAGRKLRSEELLITQFAGTRLRSELDSVLWQKKNHVSVKDLLKYFAQYVYLPRLKNSDVLLSAISEGVQAPMWEKETFAYAESWDEERQRYLGLKAGPKAALGSLTSGLVVRAEVAAAQLQADAEELARKQAEQEQKRQQVAEGGYSSPGHGGTPQVVREPGPIAQPETDIGVNAPPYSNGQGSTGQALPHAERQKQRFYGSVKINPRMMAGDAGKIMEEVVKHLTSLSKSGVSVTLEIQAVIPDGIPADIEQVVSENCRTLRFESASFEEE
ncbi:ATP-binding protein [Ktedonosporobacter rubrisoli]|uniref:ATP-binding protein n=1 Tax=Ktedonosporobacter rubrisoli TaxID=2509675 RepID=A0A4P6K017_KTERU|nr:Swt1 family HEPN domain-containing protein [Ktedonosporobacter rubrisoli]QBD80736.1 ATP-binding protein [Ktedonosporobacter rubrisoli]